MGKTKVLAAVLSGFVIVCLVMGLVVRNSYTGYGSFEEMENAVIADRAEEYPEFDSSVRDYAGLEEISDLIVKVSATDDRKLFPHTVTKTRVIVEEVWKGDVESGQELFIYEPAYFGNIPSKVYETIGGYQMMEEGEEYYLFLRRPEVSDGYRMSEKEKITYLPSTASYSKFPVREGETRVLDDQRLDTKGYTYGEVRNLEILTDRKKMLSVYKRLKSKVLENLEK